MFINRAYAVLDTRIILVMVPDTYTFYDLHI